MARWEPFNAVGGAYSDDARPWSVQDTVNYLVVQAERGGTRSPAILRGVPGMILFSASMDAAPVRGIYNAEGRLFAVAGNTLYQVDVEGAATSLGTIPGVGRCTFAHNQITGGNQVVIANGQSGYVWNTVDETLTQITDDGFPGFKSVDFADQYIIGVEPFGRYWFHSDLSDALSYNTLDRYTAEKSPDRIQQVIATGSDAFVLGERTAHFFYNTGAGTGTWANRQGAEMDRGAASPYTACRIDNTVIWLGDDGSVYRLNGYTAQRISTHALEQAISRSSMADAFAFTYEDRGHKCYLLTFPDGRTWCYDAATGEWTRRESYGLDRWRANCLTKWQGVWIAGDYTNGKLYQLDWAVQAEAGAPLERRRTFPVLHDDQNKLLIPGLELVFDTGMDEDSPPLPQSIVPPLSISGDVPDGSMGDAVSGAYIVNGGVRPYGNVTVTSGTFPPGLTLNPDGSYPGAYSAAGSYDWTVGVTDADGSSAVLADSCAVIDDRYNTVVGALLPDLWYRNEETTGTSIQNYGTIGGFASFIQLPGGGGLSDPGYTSAAVSGYAGLGRGIKSNVAPYYGEIAQGAVGSELPALGTAWTVLVWITGGAKGQQYIYEFGNFKAAIIYQFTAEKVEFFTDGASGSPPGAESRIDLPASETNPQLIAYRYNSGQWSAFKNGAKVVDVAKTFGVAVGTTHGWLARTGPASTFATDAILYDAQVYFRAISDADIAAIYAARNRA